MEPYRQGEHICAIYETADEQRAGAAEYLADGLRRGERAFYVAESRAALALFNSSLAHLGIDVEEALQRTALMQATHAEAHLQDGHFSAERMLASLNTAIEQALSAGFAGLRCCGDMSWLLGDPPGADQVVEYEALLNEMFHRTPACAMCQYDANRLPPGLLDHGLSTHPSAVIGQVLKANPFYQPPEIASRRRAEPADLPWKLRELKRR